MTLPLFSTDPLPDTHWPYYTRRLECWWVLDAPAFQVSVLHAGDTPAWRLSPASWAWFWRAVQTLCDAADKSKEPASVESATWAVGRLLEMDAWLTAHGLADDARRALSAPAVRLPDPPPIVELTAPKKIDASFNARGKADK